MDLSYSLYGFYNFIFTLALVGGVIFVVLFYIDAGYGKMRSDKWGPAISNKAGWALMEAPVFLIVLYFWAMSEVKSQRPYLVFFLLFELHYFQRSFVFPFLLKGKSQMPIIIMLLSMVWNLLNGYIQGYWLFHLAPMFSPYSPHWLGSWQFLLGVTLFFTGMAINLHSDHVIRHLRKPGDTRHYLPQKGMYRYVTSANYFGEILEWTGFALAAATPAAWLFPIWTAANLVPRAHAIYNKYKEEFGKEALAGKKRIIPFIY